MTTTLKSWYNSTKAIHNVLQSVLYNCPGGTVKPIVSHAVQVIIPRFYDDGSIDLAVISPYTKNYNTPKAYSHMRLPTETGKPGESVKETVSRCMNEEVAKDPEAFVFDISGIAYAEILDDEKNPDGLHAKIAIVMTRPFGDLRDFGKLDDDDSDEFHGPIEWVEVRKLLTEQTNGYKILGSHGKAICAFLKTLADSLEFKAVAERYYNIISSFKTSGLTSENERDALREYARM